MAGSWRHPVRVCWINEIHAPVSVVLDTGHTLESPVQFSSVIQSCPTLCDQLLCPTLGLQYARLPCPLKLMSIEFSNAIQPSHLLSSPSTPALNLSQDQGLFQWISSLHQVAKVLAFQLQHHSIQDWFLLWLTGLISLQSRGLSRVFTNTTVQKHQFFSAQLSL